jgi:YHS domain-containing protein
MSRISNLVLASLIGLTGAALADDEVNVGRGLTATGNPLALGGYDPVAYFTVGRPTPGDAKFSAVHEGATYYFASREDLAAFTADPAKYVPQFGGFCAMGVSHGRKFDGDPRVFKVYQGRLYLNLSPEVAAKFEADLANAVKRAEDNWPGIRSRPAASLK